MKTRISGEWYVLGFALALLLLFAGSPDIWDLVVAHLGGFEVQPECRCELVRE